MSQCYQCMGAELEKRQMHEELVQEIEHDSFTPLVFSCSGCMGPLASTVYMCINVLQVWFQRNLDKPIVAMTLYWLRFQLSFSLLHLAISYSTCLREPRSFKFSDSAINLTCAESHLQFNDIRHLIFVVMLNISLYCEKESSVSMLLINSYGNFIFIVVCCWQSCQTHYGAWKTRRNLRSNFNILDNRSRQV